MYQKIIDAISTQMEKALDNFTTEMMSLRTGRASSVLVERIMVEYYGQMMPLVQLASLSVSPPQTIIIQPWDKNASEPIQKAVMRSGLGITPIADGDIIRITLPALTEDRRKQLIKILDQKTEESRVVMRQERELSLIHI